MFLIEWINKKTKITNINVCTAISTVLSTPSSFICVVIKSITTSVVIASGSSVNDKLLDTAGQKKKKGWFKLNILNCIVITVTLGTSPTLFCSSYHSDPLNESCWKDWSSGWVHRHSRPPKADLRLQDTDIGTFCTLGLEITPLCLHTCTYSLLCGM